MSDEQNFEESVLQEMTTTQGWQIASSRLEHTLCSVRQRICKGTYATPEQLRDLAFLQGQEHLLQGLVDSPLAVFAQGKEREAPDEGAVKPGVGANPRRARPRGYGF